MSYSISYIIPAYNVNRRLFEKCLNSIPKDNEVIVAARGNTSPIKEVLSTRPGIRFVETDVPGAANARNLGASLATNEYIAFLDADTYLPEKFKVPDDLADYDLCIYSTEYESESKDSFHSYLVQRKHYTNNFHFSTAKNDNFLYLDTAFVIIQKSVFMSIGEFDRKLPRFEDRDLGYRLQLSGARINLIQDDSPVKVLDESTTELFTKKYKDIYYQSKVIFTRFADYTNHIPESSPLYIFYLELKTLNLLDIKSKGIPFIYLVMELIFCLLLKIHFQLTRVLYKNLFIRTIGHPCLITSKGKSIFLAFEGEKAVPLIIPITGIIYVVLRFFFTREIMELHFWALNLMEIIFAAGTLFLHRSSLKKLFTIPRQLWIRCLTIFLFGILIASSQIFMKLPLPFYLTNVNMFFLVIGIAPIVEEVLFRLLLWAPFQKQGRRLLGWIVTSLLFSYGHYHAAWNAPPELHHFFVFQTIYSLILGIACGSTMYFKGSLAGAILIHLFFNLGFLCRILFHIN